MSIYVNIITLYTFKYPQLFSSNRNVVKDFIHNFLPQSTLTSNDNDMNLFLETYMDLDNDKKKLLFLYEYDHKCDVLLFKYENMHPQMDVRFKFNERSTVKYHTLKKELIICGLDAKTPSELFCYANFNETVKISIKKQMNTYKLRDYVLYVLIPLTRTNDLEFYEWMNKTPRPFVVNEECKQLTFVGTHFEIPRDYMVFIYKTQTQSSYHTLHNYDKLDYKSKWVYYDSFYSENGLKLTEISGWTLMN